MTAPPNAPDLEELSRLADAATPGPWEVTGESSHQIVIGPPRPNGTYPRGVAELMQGDWDAAFIAAANPLAIKWLLGRVAELEAERAEADADYDALRGLMHDRLRERDKLAEALRTIAGSRDKLFPREMRDVAVAALARLAPKPEGT